jgi:recombination protein RecA
VTQQADDNKKQALEVAISHIEKQFGKGSIMTLGKHSASKEVSVIKTGAITLDIALGIGGVPRGRIVEIYGPESSGKSTLATHIVANVQKNGGIAAYIDAEHALDPAYAATIGVKLDELLISQPGCGEEALNIAVTLALSGAVEVIIIDSVAALVPRNELEGEVGDSFVGLQARMMSQALRKLTATLAKSGTCAIFINQIREKIGVMFGNPETTTGGRALKFYASVRIEIRRIGGIKSSDATPREIGNRVRAKVVKNKMAPPFRNAEFDILFSEGISRVGALLDSAVEMKIVAKKGTWFSYNDQRLGQGREAAIKELKNHPVLVDELEKIILLQSAENGGSLLHETSDIPEQALVEG